jgi:hypothetical protein
MKEGRKGKRKGGREGKQVSNPGLLFHVRGDTVKQKMVNQLFKGFKQCRICRQMNFKGRLS